MITPEQMVQREVLCCMSSLVSTLAQSSGALERNNKPSHYARELLLLQEQASELAAPVLDYEEAAIQNGWVEDEARRTAEEYCNKNGIDPYEWEVYEHWAVSTWLAEKLQAQGERIDTDFAGLNIWTRTTTGQAISTDGCIARIYVEMTTPHTLDSVAPGA